MKIGLAQINPIIGDFTYNCNKIIEFAKKAKENGCRLVVFPELAVTGYPPQDLLLRPAFINDQQRAVAEMVARLPEIDVLFGAVVGRNKGSGKKLYNTALVARKGAIVSYVHKKLLPTYDVFDETRYFEPGSESGIYQLEDSYWGITVCEDAWSGDSDLYRCDPIFDLVHKARQEGKKLSGIINISASPFQQDKQDQRNRVIEKICTSQGLGFLYANQVGGQDSLLFDGCSFAMDNHGKVVARAHSFSEDLICLDTSTWQGDIHGEKLAAKKAILEGLVMGVRDYVRKCGFSSVVIGLSGGIDSALTAAIAVRALGPENVLGVAMPSPYSSDHSLADSISLSENLGCRFDTIPIAGILESFNRGLEPIFPAQQGDLTEQNLQARIRGNLLMAISNKFGSLLLTTGNKSEMAVGYCTLYGDMSGGLAVISDLPKQLVYGLANFINEDKEIIPANIINKPPSAELRPDQLDQDDLPDYEILDAILALHLEEGLGLAEITAVGFDRTVVQDILARVKINEYKRKQAPLGLKVTTKAFGIGRRFPNVQNYQG